MKILVTGGAGYIGSFMVKRLLERGDEVVVADNLSRGHKEAVDSRAELLVGDLLEPAFVERIFLKNKFDAVVHFAGYISMGESMEKPFEYFNNNVFGALNLLQKMQEKGINNFIFSSTAGVYGNPVKVPILEDHVKKPTNPYGESKLIVEQILFWFNKVHGTSFAALRYFNAAGAASDGSIGESHSPETHIIPKAIQAALRNEEFKLYGTDYDTKDGTCVRDYIHVLDLIEAHVLAIEKLQEDGGANFYNVGTGTGYSNREVLDEVKKVSGIDFKITLEERRPGDADVLIADAACIKQELGFNPVHSDLETIVQTAWKWHSKKHNE